MNLLPRSKFVGEMMKGLKPLLEVLITLLRLVLLIRLILITWA